MMIMRTRHKDHLPQRKGNRMPATAATRRQPVRRNDTSAGRIVVVETVHSAQDIIRISIETAGHARQSEPIILF